MTMDKVSAEKRPLTKEEMEKNQNILTQIIELSRGFTVVDDSSSLLISGVTANKEPSEGKKELTQSFAMFGSEAALGKNLSHALKRTEGLDRILYIAESLSSMHTGDPILDMLMEMLGKDNVVVDIKPKP